MEFEYTSTSITLGFFHTLFSLVQILVGLQLDAFHARLSINGYSVVAVYLLFIACGVLDAM